MTGVQTCALPILGLARGKKLYDKRQDIAKRDIKRESERDFKIRMR